MDTALTFFVLFCVFGVLAGVGLLPFRKRRRLGKWFSISGVVGIVAAFVIFVFRADDIAKEAGFINDADRRVAKEHGYSDAREWAPVRERLAQQKAEAAVEAAREREEAAKRAAAEERIKQEQCAADLKCAAEKAWAEATTRCSPIVERVAKHNFEWTDRWYETKFTHFKWGDPMHSSITFMGDKIKYQNGFGAWTFYTYECDFMLASKSVKDVRAYPGRLPP